MPIDLYPNIAKVKRDGVYQNLPGFVQQSGDADIKAMIANSETSTTAQFPHKAGSYFILNDVFYQADDNIAVNDIIAVGTNCHVDVLGNDVEENAKNISDLNNSFDEYKAHSYTRIICGDGDGKWVQGGFNTNTGKSTTTNYKTKMASDMRGNSIIKIETDDDTYQFVVISWGLPGGSGSFEGIYQPSTNTYIKTSVFADIEWYSSLDISLLNDRLYSIMAHHIVNGEEVTITTSEAAQHFRFYRYSPISDDEIIEYAADNKKIYDEMVFFEVGGITADGGNYEGNATYKAATKRSDFIIPTCDNGDFIFFETKDTTKQIRVYVYKSDSSVEYIGYDSPVVAAQHKTGNKYRVVIQMSNGTGSYDAVEAMRSLRVYTIKKPTTPIAVTPSKKQFCVMSHNVGQWYNGTGNIVSATNPVSTEIAYNDLHKKIIDRSCPDILCCQEYTEKINILGNYYDDISVKNSSNNNIYSGKAIASNYNQSNVTIVEYTNQKSGSTISCNYTYSYVWLNGRNICVVNTHLSTDISVAKLQMTELMTFAETQDYIIICGDFNINCSAVSDQNYIDAFKPWIDLGYNMANYSDWGFMITCYNTLSDQVAIDNIITSENIEITYACVDYQKRDDALDSKIDHMPIIAYVEIN